MANYAATQGNMHAQETQGKDKDASNIASDEGPDASKANKAGNEPCNKKAKTQHHPRFEEGIVEGEGDKQPGKSNAHINPLDDPDGLSNQEDDEWDVPHAYGEDGVGPWAEPQDQQQIEQGERPQFDPIMGRGKRLVKKTQPWLTPYLHIKPRGDKHEQTSRKRKNQEILVANVKQRRKQIASAISTITGNIGIVNEKAVNTSTGAEEMYDWNFAKQIHSTHEIRSVRPNYEAFYCARCGYYNDGGQLRELRKPCPGFVASECTKFQDKERSLGTVGMCEAPLPSPPSSCN